MDWLTTLLVGAGGGIIVLAAEHLVLFLRDWRRERANRVVKFSNHDRVITGEIFTSLSPGSTVALMQDVLGVPDKIFDDYGRVFKSEGEDPETPHLEWEPTNSYLYRFKNARVKVTSKDKESIDSLTVIALDKKIEFEDPSGLFDRKTQRLGKSKVTQELIEMCIFEIVATKWVKTGAFMLAMPNPAYVNMTFFVEPDFEKDLSEANNYLYRPINGICICSDYLNVFFIHENEFM